MNDNGFTTICDLFGSSTCFKYGLPALIPAEALTHCLRAWVTATAALLTLAHLAANG